MLEFIKENKREEYNRILKEWIKLNPIRQKNNY